MIHLIGGVQNDLGPNQVFGSVCGLRDETAGAEITTKTNLVTCFGCFPVHISQASEAKNQENGIWRHKTYCGISFFASPGSNKPDFDTAGVEIEARAEAWGWRANCPKCLTAGASNVRQHIEALVKLAKAGDVYPKWVEGRHKR